MDQIGNSAMNFLFTHWEGGGNTPPILSIARRLVQRGHRVRMLADLCNREEAGKVGVDFTSWARLPQRPDRTAAYDPIRDWETKNPIGGVARLRDRLMYGPALAYAQDVLDELKRQPADLVVVTDFLYGAMAAAEKSGIPFAVLSPNIYPYPASGIPPFGPGLYPASGLLGRLRDKALQKFNERIFAKGLPALNTARRELGLPALDDPYAQVRKADRFLVLTSMSFDFPATSLPANVMYTGPELDDPYWSESRDDHPQLNEANQQPLVLVSLSTTYQNQAPLLQRIMDALSELDCRALVTTGPGLGSAQFRVPANVELHASVPHSLVMPRAALTVTHAGHGTVIRSLSYGVPLVCIPMGRDQNDTAARVVARGAGVRLKQNAGPATIRDAMRQVLADSTYRQAAQRLGKKIRLETNPQVAVETLEGLVRRSAPVSSATHVEHQASELIRSFS